MRRLAWSYLGRVEYDEAVRLQLEVRDRVQNDESPDTLLLLEHPPVFTLGRSANPEDVLLPTSVLDQRGISVAECDRGGLATYHGPGQLVGYPIIDLNPDRRDVRRYVRDLQAVLIAVLAHYGIEATGRMTQPEIGVWVAQKKIASIGVHLSRWVTTHGFALNVTTDLSMFAGIVACGMPTVEMTSIAQETGSEVPLAEVAETCAEVFGRVFSSDLETLTLAGASAGVSTCS
jgi:lipoyl(octanoyl) transferase